MAAADEDPYTTFRRLVIAADRKFSITQTLPPHARSPHHLIYLSKTFKSYTKLWRFQQSHCKDLVGSDLNRWEIGEIASRIGQLYYNQYLRTTEIRFLVEAYVFYEAILSRKYFEARRGLVFRWLSRCLEYRFGRGEIIEWFVAPKAKKTSCMSPSLSTVEALMSPIAKLASLDCTMMHLQYSWTAWT